MAVDGYLNFDVKVNTDGFEKGSDRINQKAKRTGSDVVQTAENTVDQVVNTAAECDPNIKISVDGDKAISEADEINQRIQAILDNSERSNQSKAASIAAIYKQMGMDASEAMTKAWGCIERGTAESEKVSDSAKRSSKKIKSTIKDIDNTVDKSVDKNSININDALDKLKSKFKGVAAAVGIAFGIKEVISFSKKAIESAAEVNAANSQLEQTFGSMQFAAEEAMQRVADASGIVATRLKGVGTSIYAFAKASGMDSVQALDMMEEALQIAADSAAYYDRSLEDTSETLKSFLKGNYANDAALGISCTETTRNAAANRLYGKSFQELSEAQKQLALLQMVKDANDLSGATGQAAREADGWENVLGNLKETWKQLLAVIGQPILKFAVSAVQELTAALSFLLEKAQIAVNTLSELFGWELGNTASVAENISQSVSSQNALTDAVEDTAKAQEKSTAGFDEINTLASSDESQTKNSSISPKIENAPLVVNAETSGASKAVIDFIGRVKKIFSKLRKWLSKNFSPVFGNIWDGLVSETRELYTTVQKIFDDIKALCQPLAKYFKGDFTVMLKSSLRVAGETLVGLYDSFNKVFSDIWSIAVYPNLTDFITIGLPIIAQFRTAVINVLGTLFYEVKNIFDMLWEDAVRPILGFITEIWHDIMLSIKDFWDKWGNPVFEKFCDAITLTGDTLEKIWKDVLKPIFDKLMTVLDDIWSKHLKQLVDNFLDFVGVLVDGALDIYNKFILPVVNWFVEKFGPPIAKVFQFILETAGNVIGGVIDAVSHIINALKGVVDFVAGVFTGDWERAWDGIKDIFSGIWNALVDVVKVPINLIIDLVNGLIGAIESGLNWIISSINKLSFEVPDWVPGLGGKKFGFDIPDIDLPEIPHLAQGTVVPANYGNFLAVLGDNKRETEVVSPLSTIKKAVADALAENGGNVPKELIVYTYLFPNSAAFHREVIKIVNSDRSRRGG